MADQPNSPGAGLQNEGYAPATSHKRKREDGEQDDNGRLRHPHTTNGDSATSQSQDPLHEQLLQAISQANGIPGDDSARTAQAALATPMPSHAYPEPYDTQPPGLSSFVDDPSHSPSGGMMSSAAVFALHAAREASTPSTQPKPAVGTPQWHQQRKDNHKEVERRRRETINDGINEIAKIVPGCEKNKGSILHRAVIYIGELHESQRTWTNERATMSAVVSELHIRIDQLKDQKKAIETEAIKWQQRCRDAGLQFDDYAQIGTTGDSENIIPE